jgi:hypothetical protein
VPTYKVDIHYTASIDGCQSIEVEAGSEAEATEAALHAFDKHGAWDDSRHETHFRLTAESPEPLSPPKRPRKKKP